MIPPDLASSLRSLIDSTIQAPTPTPSLPSGLPQFEAGQRFSALIQNPLPDGSFRALVAGTTITLALPGSVKSGDTLELVVTGREGNTVYARPAAQTGSEAAAANSGARPALSQTGQLISQLLTGRFSQPAPLPLNSSGPLLNAPPQNAAQIAPMLRQVVGNSGLFYESHLRQWADGKLPLSALLQEPQAQQSPLASQPAAQQSPSAQAAANAQAAQTASAPLPNTATQPQTSSSTLAQPGTGPAAMIETEHPDLILPRGEGAHTRAAQLEAFAEQAAPRSSARPVAEALMPVVSQQLETLATHQMAWQGQIWPGAQLQWEIIHPDEQRSAQDAEDDSEARGWRSDVRVQLPVLGEVFARLVLGEKGLSVFLDTPESGTAERMRAGQSELYDALAAAGITVLQMQVSDHVRA